MPREGNAGFTANGIVTLTSDFGTRDGYVGAMKGVMLAIDASLGLHDLAHDLPPQAVRHAAAVLRSACPRFPPGTVHLAVIDPGVGSDRAPLVLAAGGHAFVGPDNGLFAPVAAALGGARIARRIERAGTLGALLPAVTSATFHGRDVFAPTAAALASRRVGIDEVGPPHDPAPLPQPLPHRSGVDLAGEVTHFDRFGNAITNLHVEELPKSPAALTARLEGGERLRFVATYAEAAAGELVALVGSDGFVELAVRGGSARERLAAATGALVRLVVAQDAG